MKLHQVRDVIAVAERGSLRAAARSLGIAQSAVTRSIRQLEQELGVPLFERRNRGAVLTAMGNLFLRRARIAANELGRAREEIQQHQGGSEGKVVACLSVVPHIMLLPRVLKPFQKRYPKVQLHIIEGVVYQSAEPALRDGRIDFYVGLPPIEPHGAGLIVQKLFDNNRIVMGRVGHPLAGARSIRDLINAEWASGNDPADLQIEKVFRSFSLKSPRILATAESALSLIVLIAYSDMLALLPRQWAEFAPVRTLLQEIRVKEAISAPAITLVRRADMPLTPAAEHLCDLLQAAARTNIEGRMTPKQRPSGLARA